MQNWRGRFIGDGYGRATGTTTDTEKARPSGRHHPDLTAMFTRWECTTSSDHNPTWRSNGGRVSRNAGSKGSGRRSHTSPNRLHCRLSRDNRHLSTHGQDCFKRVTFGKPQTPENRLYRLMSAAVPEDRSVRQTERLRLELQIHVLFHAKLLVRAGRNRQLPFQPDTGDRSDAQVRSAAYRRCAAFLQPHVEGTVGSTEQNFSRRVPLSLKLLF